MPRQGIQWYLTVLSGNCTRYNTSEAPQGEMGSRAINCVLQFDVKLSEFLKPENPIFLRSPRAADHN